MRTLPLPRGLKNTLSIIVPVWNEQEVLPPLLAHLRTFQERGVEVLFVDGGSDDGTPALIEAAGFSVMHADRGRARQMNAGAHAAAGSVLLFLHADTVLPDAAARQVAAALAGGRRRWGRFDVTISGKPLMLRVVATMMNLRSRWSGIATGDQAIFVTREAFNAVGGFPDQPLMEDVALTKRLRRLSRPACIALRVITSGRRWERDGVWRTIFLMWRLRWAYWRGIPASVLARSYHR